MTFEERSEHVRKLVFNHLRAATLDCEAAIRLREREECALELEVAFAECETLNLLHGAARIRARNV